MSSFLTTTAKQSHVTPIPPAVSRETGVAVLQDHDFFIKTGPYLVKYTTLTPSCPDDAVAASKAYKMPADVTPLGTPPVKVYELLDHMPNAFWSSDIISTEEVVDCASGVWTRVRSPLGIVMESRWTVRPKKDGDGCELVQDVCISCNRVLMPVVKGQVGSNFAGIHDKLVRRMVEVTGEGQGA